MKIGIDARLWRETGVGRYLRNLVFHLQKIDTTNDYVLFVLSNDRQAGCFDFAQGENSRWQIVETDVHWHSVAEQLTFPLVLERAHVDVMHFPYFSVPIFYTRPYIVTIHDLILHHFSTGEATTRNPLFYQAKRLGYKHVIKTASQQSKKIITVSQATKDEIVDHLHVPESKIVVTYEGVDSSFFSNQKSAFTLQNNNFNPHKDKFFLSVGNAYPHKNLQRLLVSYKEISKKHTEVKFVFVGKDDFFYKRLRDQVKTLGLVKSTIFLNEVTDENLRYLYARALALVMPSLMEGFGLPPLEAMSQKGLVAVSDIPVAREIYKKGALYFDPYSSDEIASCLEKIISNRKQFSSVITAGYERAQEFSWEKMAKQTKAVYESL